ncbi:protein-glutamate O-methyltransferase CheR [Pseudoroseomonas cervicalis]|uniref:CheR family methyltransferase n=1 Tax=Teichococcus cervicalis TaxID=204525 RepID=UPI00277E64D2|nr:protein-glutamate O-methyltransferase CheR [Pseudoroseomonas cervicalis]MDQ1079514.1 chemotaxis protein methyltransferase CheR [Pseudoroseomonas cervicalis]
MSESGFHDIARAIRGVSGLVLAPEQDYLLETRLGPVLRRHGLPDLPALARRLRAPGSAALAREAALATATHETSFFRDEAPFLHLARALPRLAAARGGPAKLRFWSAACSSGQEACSLAILADELRHQLGGRGVEIIGTDLSPAMVERARQALYSGFEVRRGLSEARLAHCFAAEAEGHRLRPGLRALCRFEQANLVEEPAIAGPFEVIMLRNLLIYLDAPTKERVVEHCARRLAPEGVLYLGAAEVLLSLRTRMAPLPGCHGAYRLDTPAARAFWEAAA